MMEDEYFEYAPQEILQELHRMGHEIIGLVVKIMEAPVKNAHYTEAIGKHLDEMDEMFEEYGIKGDGNRPQAIAQPIEEGRTLQDALMDMAQTGLIGFIDKLRED